MLRWLHVADRLQQPPMIEPIDPVEARELDGLEMPPRSEVTNHLGFEEADDRLGLRIASAADGGRDPRVGKAVCSASRDIARHDHYDGRAVRSSFRSSRR